MAKNRLNRKQIQRLQRKAEMSKAVDTATRIRLAAEALTKQSELDTWLLQCEDLAQRRQMYDYIKQYLKFESVFPEKRRIILM